MLIKAEMTVNVNTGKFRTITALKLVVIDGD